MIVTLTDGSVMKDVSPVNFCTGYRASQISMQPGDFRQLAELASHNPQQFNAVMQQLEGRFPREPGLEHATNALAWQDAETLLKGSRTPGTLEVTADDSQDDDQGPAPGL